MINKDLGVSIITSKGSDAHRGIPMFVMSLSDNASLLMEIKTSCYLLSILENFPVPRYEGPTCSELRAMADSEESVEVQEDSLGCCTVGLVAH